MIPDDFWTRHADLVQQGIELDRLLTPRLHDRLSAELDCLAARFWRDYYAEALDRRTRGTIRPACTEKPVSEQVITIRIEGVENMASKKDLQDAVEALKQRVAEEVGEVKAVVDGLVAKVDALKAGAVEGEVLVTQSELDALVADLNAISEKVEAISGPEGAPAGEPVSLVPEPGTSIEGETASEDVPGDASGANKPAGEAGDVFSSESPAKDPQEP